VRSLPAAAHCSCFVVQLPPSNHARSPHSITHTHTLRSLDAVRRDASSRGTVSAGRDGSYESPRQRLERLRAETRELEEYLETMSATSAATESGSIAAVRRADVVGLVADVEQLQAQLLWRRKKGSMSQDHRLNRRRKLLLQTQRENLSQGCLISLLK
jgi:hypothetical protein